MPTPRETVNHLPAMFHSRSEAIAYAKAHGYRYVTCLLGAKEYHTHWATDVLLTGEYVVAMIANGKMVIR